MKLPEVLLIAGNVASWLFILGAVCGLIWFMLTMRAGPF